jgi:hypothetical protein
MSLVIKVDLGYNDIGYLSNSRCRTEKTIILFLLFILLKHPLYKHFFLLNLSILRPYKAL